MADDPAEESTEFDLSGTQDCVSKAKLGAPNDHWHLHAVCIKLPTDFEPYGFRVRNGPDCSCGCKWFLKLQALPYDWGACSNPRSPRCGLLTFEHQGCEFFDYDERLDDLVEKYKQQRIDKS